MIFVGNLPQGQSVESLVKTSHLFASFPDVMVDSALFDRFHAYVPGWEIPKMRTECWRRHRIEPLSPAAPELR